MTKVEKIERAIEQLSKSEFMQLRDWILQRDWQSWDAQIERDAGAGKLDELVGESQEDYRAGGTAMVGVPRNLEDRHHGPRRR
jgi:hypothetical protein